MNRYSELKIFAGRSSMHLAEKIANSYGCLLGSITINMFSDGEMQPVINESVRGAYVFFVQSTPAPAENLMELLLMIDAAKRASAGYITAVMPYFGYARQDRKDKPRVPISAKLVAELIQAAGANRVMTMDFHADQIQGFFDVPVDHLQSEAVFIPHLAEMELSNVIFASPDVGGVKRARAYAKHFHTDLVICDKYREKANEVAGMTVIGNVQNANVILVDDLVDTAGTLCRAAEVLMEKGAKSVKALCTHPILSGKAYETVEKSLLQQLIVCDTLPLHPEKFCTKSKVLSAAELFATAIRNTHENKSISKLFIAD
ncbi:MAG: ribose-phosphate pyrophosphokinase [Saprospiraceae bacterium]|nr:ribose-phosphate pyrophosphokinase [Saprospiraceae bacterium]